VPNTMQTAASRTFKKRASAAGTLANLDEALDKARKQVSKGVLTSKNVADISGHRDIRKLAETKIEAKAALAALSGEAAEGIFAPNVTELINYVNGLDKIIADNGTLVAPNGLRDLHGRLNSSHKKFSGKGWITGRDKMSDKFYKNTLGSAFEDGFIDRIGLEGGKRLKALNAMAEKRRFNAAAEDFFDAVTDKGFGAALWSQAIKPRIEAWTPAFYVQNAFKKTTAFGSVIDEDNIYGWAKNIINLPGLRKAFRNNVRIKFGSVNFLTQGGSWAHAAIDLEERFSTSRELIGFINSANADAYTKDFLKWLEKNKGALGLQFVNGKLIDSPSNFAKLQGVIKTIGIRNSDPNYAYKITAEYAGWLQKYTTKLNQIQAKIFKVLGKRFKKLLSLRTVIAEAAAAAITAALGLLSGGVLTAIGVWVDRAVRFIVTKIYDVTIGFAKKLLRLDIEGAMEELEKALAQAVKILAGCVTIPILFFLVMMFMLISWFSSISPQDPTRRDNVLVGSESSLSGECRGLLSSFGGKRPSPTSEATAYFSNFISAKLTDEVMSAYGFAEEQTGVPCEILAGIHFMEGGNNPNQSLQDGRPIDPATLPEDAKRWAEHYKEKLGGRAPTTYERAITGLSRYNGGGNSNCWAVSQGLSNYSKCPPAYEGEDDSYATNWMDSAHDNMAIIYPIDFTTSDTFCDPNTDPPLPNGNCPGGYALCSECPPPIPVIRPGAMTVAAMVQ